MLGAAIKCALVYWALQAVSLTFMLEVLTRPIVCSFFMGLALGDVKTALIMGAQLEAIYMGTMVIGAVTPSDSTLGSMVAVSFVILTGIDLEAGVASRDRAKAVPSFGPVPPGPRQAGVFQSCVLSRVRKPGGWLPLRFARRHSQAGV